MASDATADDAAVLRRQAFARGGVLTLAILKSIVILVVAIALMGMSGQDPAGAAMSAGFFVAALLYWLIFVVPVLWLAAKDRRLVFCALLLIAPDLLLALAILGT